MWAKVTGALPRVASLMRIRAAAMKTMDDFMLLAQLTDAVRQHCDVRFSHLELPWLPYARQDRHMQPGDSFALKVFARQLNTLGFDKVIVLDRTAKPLPPRLKIWWLSRRSVACYKARHWSVP